MSILKIYQGSSLQALLAEIVSPVEVVYLAVDQPEPDTLAALSDLAALTPHLTVTIQPAPHNLAADRVIVRSQNGRELIFAGAPLGLELAALVSAIVVAGRSDSGLTPPTRQALAGLRTPVYLEIFTTPTWPTCAQAVSLVHKFAFESLLITAEAVSAVVMVELAQHYQVKGTPHLVLNGERHWQGRMSEEQLLMVIQSLESV